MYGFTVISWENSDFVRIFENKIWIFFIRNLGIWCSANMFRTLYWTYFNKKISDNGIKGLSNITSLKLRRNDNISDEGIRELWNLTYLDLWYNEQITNKGTKGLSKIKTIDR